MKYNFLFIGVTELIILYSDHSIDHPREITPPRHTAVIPTWGFLPLNSLSEQGISLKPVPTEGLAPVHRPPPYGTVCRRSS